MSQNITQLKKLIKKWKKRRDKLGKQASALRKIDTEANKKHSYIFFGEFREIEKCRSELVAILNKMIKEEE